ncbi:hypothetical protein DRH29_00825 [candidate division Kazan bacterium]|uniref:Methicillin resistance protein n=1 Tax=candidate division Kazan bacterium TaxID=2202143 RepID=A0A420ZDD2_UNCK3|nr:MAG: hypothetical protein DRH29_00825 [candidate division Kazan bacterium]
MKLLDDKSLDKKSWDSALLSRSDAHFLQSWAWGDFNKKLNNQVWRLAVEDEGVIINQLLVVKLNVGFGFSLLYSPKGNLINKELPVSSQQTSSKLLLDKIKSIAQKNRKIILFRIDPHVLTSDTTTPSFYHSLGFILNQSKNIQPKHSLLLDLTQPLDSIMKKMKQKTRYNINLAAKYNMDIHISTNPADIEIFLDLAHATSERNKFALHPDNYYRTQFEVLSQNEIQRLMIAEYEHRPIAAILVNTFGDTATYVHGASGDSDRNLMAPYLLQSSAIIKAKDDGIKIYDFWGIHPNPNHSWAGITRFKRGFGGNEVEYIGTLELPLNSTFYRLYKFVNQYRKA